MVTAFLPGHPSWLPARTVAGPQVVGGARFLVGDGEGVWPKGQHTPGVDGVVVDTPEARVQLLQEGLSLKGYRPSTAF